MAIASHRRHFAIIVTQASAIMQCDNVLDQWIRFFAIIKIFLNLQYYQSSFAIFDNFLRLEKLAKTSYTQFLINTKLQNNISKCKILLERANALFFTFKIKNSKF